MDIKKISLSGWGNNISIFSNVYNPENNDEIINIILKNKISNFITRGLGRSYGDSSLADNVISLENYKKVFNFDKSEGILECSSNYSLGELMKIILEKGWFFNVTPGSKFVTIGGAIASDVHGKNHHLDDGDLKFKEKKTISIPSKFPGFLLNKYIIKLFNKIYYHFHKNNKKFKQDLDSFFYPLDNINYWNNLYGKNGFTQIQILVEENDPEIILNKILDFFQVREQHSFLGTIKEFGKSNNNYLSFPSRGYTLTLDLKITKKLNKVYQEFEDLLKNYKVKIYLTKDSFMSEQYFKKTYNNYNKFKEIKNKHDPLNLINSFQSRRIGI